MNVFMLLMLSVVWRGHLQYLTAAAVVHFQVPCLLVFLNAFRHLTSGRRTLVERSEVKNQKAFDSSSCVVSSKLHALLNSVLLICEDDNNICFSSYDRRHEMIKYSSTKEDAQGSETMSPECDTQCSGLTASSLLSPWLRVLPVS